MLSIGKMGHDQQGYYLGKVAEGAEDYYSGEGEAEGYWLGDAAEDLGLQGKVDPDQLTAMLTGTNPASGEPLGLRHVEDGIPGFDLTFSAPKSVSVLWALGGHPVAAEVKAAHAAAVEAGLGYLQREACWTRRGAGGHEFLQGNGFLAAGYVHRSSRAGDMQIHTHVLVANATFAEGRWTRLHHPSIYEHAKTASYIYEAHLRDELARRLGVRWREVLNGLSEIEGFDPDHLRAFSTRHQQILEAAGDGASARYAGLRRGELQALRCEDIDLARSLIHVKKGWDQEEGEIEPKSEAAKRTIPLLAILRDFLDEQLVRTGRTGTDRIFGRAADQVFYPSTIDGRARRAWKAYNLAEREAAEEEKRAPVLLTMLTLHECRHTFASLLIDTGANPKAIQVVMGHSKIQTTFDVYGHLLPGSYDDVRARMDAYLAREGEKAVEAAA